MSIETIMKTIASGFTQFSFRDLVDILLITAMIYKLIVLTKGTRAYQVLKGVAIFS